MDTTYKELYEQALRKIDEQEQELRRKDVIIHELSKIIIENENED